MSQICPKCHQESQLGARFCTACGATLAATLVQQRTVLGPPPVAPLRLSGEQVTMILRSAESAFGNRPVSLVPALRSRSAAGQREHTVYVMDVSGSMEDPYDRRLTKMEAAIRAGINLILNKANTDANDEVGLAVFESLGTEVVPLAPLHSHKSQLIEALQGLSPGRGTDIDEGLRTAADMFDWSRKRVVRRITLLTDGLGGDPLDTARELKSRGVLIEVIGIGDCPENVDGELLEQVASTVDGELRYKFIKDLATLVQTVTAWAAKTQTR